MLSDKALKEKYRPEFWKHPSKHYATAVLETEGFKRHTCSVCKKPFWSTSQRPVCGDPSCSPDESFGFIGKSPAKNPLSYVEVWKKFSKMFKRLGYTPIRRYPTVARWNPTMEFTNASIAAFQPFVVSGEVSPPANPLVIPQFCFRTVDIDNVGITMSHFTGFVMIGQHLFVPPSSWNQNKVFQDIYSWLSIGLGIPKDELILHEDAWAGGGNFGPCMEFFSRGCEIANQVYMTSEQTNKGVKELSLKVLDMGMGMERCAWFSQGASTGYDATFPEVIKKLCAKTGIRPDRDLLLRYVPHAGRLNLDEVPDISKAWKKVSTHVGIDVSSLQKQILPLSALYSVGEHARTLLVLFSDGALPSNIGGGYNLRVLIRRVLSFLDKYQWNLDLSTICKWHSSELRPIFPELRDNFNDVERIISVEEEKYSASKEKSRKVLSGMLKKSIPEKKLLQLYDSHGITPELVGEEARHVGIKVHIPENFYSKVALLHEKKEQAHATKKEIILNVKNVPSTNALYFNDHNTTEFQAQVVYVKGKNVILNETYFYPTSGGQMHDVGMVGEFRVVHVIKQGDLIIHELYSSPSFRKGDIVSCTIDKERRTQLTKHHDAAHILLAASRKVLGNHIHQASAFKDVDKAHLDISHYRGLSFEEVKAIEKEANRLVKANLPISKEFMERTDAEQRYGMNIYQGPAVPGKRLRIVSIGNVDVEACGGTHDDQTSSIGRILITKAGKISDAVIRLEYLAGNAAEKYMNSKEDSIDSVASFLNVPPSQIPGRAEEIFLLWKEVVKKKKKVPIKLSSSEKYKGGNILEEAARRLKTQPEHVLKTLKRFLKDLECLT
ncbi:alanine--tRNA ligase [Candidatus Woesearchaeota archaeon]|nr:alanine--tRNA ligase [Candidatus Woesearchaeota archaeon]